MIGNTFADVARVGLMAEEIACRYAALGASELGYRNSALYEYLDAQADAAMEAEKLVSEWKTEFGREEMERRGYVDRLYADLTGSDPCSGWFKYPSLIGEMIFDPTMASGGKVKNITRLAKEIEEQAMKTPQMLRRAEQAAEKARRAAQAEARAAAENAASKGGLNLFRYGKDGAATRGAVDGWREGDRMLHLPPQGSPQANWAQNAGHLREEMRKGQPIFDSYRDASTGLQIPAGTTPTSEGRFLNAERRLLESRGWRYNPQTGAYHPPSS